MSFSNEFTTYFAAANGYDGFRSYFGYLFKPEKYERLYILKGGPGTGKSTLMRGLEAHFSALGFGTKKILCSSDTNSLDGVIIHCENKKFAVIDGTAPHEVDAKIPGAYDEIINLGTAWDKEMLVKQRKEILDASEKKNIHYKKAYEFLKLASNFSNRLNAIKHQSSAIFFEEIENDILCDLTNKNNGRMTDIKLISSFGKFGHAILKDEFLPKTKRIFVLGKSGTEALFMTCLYKSAVQKRVNFTLFPSPFSHDIIEGIYLEDNNTFVSTILEAETKIDTSHYADFINDDATTTFSDSIHTELLKRAKEEFTLASSAHFELERIYTPLMNFDKISKIRDQIVYEIINSLK